MSASSDPTLSIASVASTLAKDIYGDVAGPAARQVGTALESVFKLGLSPIAMLNWGFEHAKVWLTKRVEEKLLATPAEYRVQPPIALAVAAINGVALAADTPSVRDLYGELLVKALDVRTADSVHPSFISVIGQLSAAEALLFMSFASKADKALFQEKRRNWAGASSETLEQQFTAYCASLGFVNMSQAAVWLVNLQRLGLIQVDRDSDISYVPEDDDGNRPSVDTVEYRYLYVTEFGVAFLNACSPESAP